MQGRLPRTYFGMNKCTPAVAGGTQAVLWALVLAQLQNRIGVKLRGLASSDL